MLALEHEAECTAAVLQPLHAQGHLSLAGLVAAGFDAAVIRAVDALTPRPGESRLDAAARASSDPIARAVRLAECTEEIDFTGMPGLSAQDYALIEEYRLVREVLVAGVLHEAAQGERAHVPIHAANAEGRPATPLRVARALTSGRG
jgi:GTP diphosphokinase / guanosine-3',5'-bis(diphosphate) 3'-diphosphatase